MAAVDRLGWAAQSSFRVGSYDVGVRSNTLEVDRALREILAAHVLPDVTTDRDYSIRVATANPGARADLQFLFRGCRTVVRSRHTRAVIDALVRRLDALGPGDTRRIVRLAVPAFVHEGRAILVPSWVPRTARVVTRLERAGFRSTGAEYTDLDLDTATVVLGTASLRVDEKALASWSARLDSGRRPPFEPIAPGLYAVAAWLFLDRTGSDPDPSQAQAVSLGLRMVRNADSVGGPMQALKTLAAVFGSAEPAVLPRGERDVVGFIHQVLARRDPELPA